MYESLRVNVNIIYTSACAVYGREKVERRRLLYAHIHVFTDSYYVCIRWKYTCIVRKRVIVNSLTFSENVRYSNTYCECQLLSYTQEYE